MANIVKGFLVTGIWPFNDNIFGEEEFLSSYVTDRPQEESEPAAPIHSICHSRECEEMLAEPSTSGENQHAVVSPHIIRPFPKAGPRKTAGKKRRKGKTRILTDTPIKDEIEEYKSAGSKAKNSVKKVMKQVFDEE